MRDLNIHEMNEVSGAGVIADAGTALGRGIGAIVENCGVEGATDAGASLGTGIGQVVEVGVNLVGSIFGGLFGGLFR
ncbi:hypothetical protein HQN64_24375 [Enterobacteriaceae bacterium BIT-l23]|uniref:Uncharacterized protein n=1 Tax=Jejubacter calystegiae TaxID=2579935 RepID=A0A4P8YN24_9ENTR|nr:hypothetical protein [Jejubacter calystegiae]NUU69196.1 hypothetical protein [Enterobacteriaceae bacterium BIT-l23]QCT22249.1 hypothetical protein FEM41_22650 [Jejubacter calystegiae]